MEPFSTTLSSHFISVGSLSSSEKKEENIGDWEHNPELSFVFAFFFGLPFHELYSAAKQSFQMLKRKGDQTAPKSRRAACSKGVSGRLCVSALDREKGEGKREKGEGRQALLLERAQLAD